MKVVIVDDEFSAREQSKRLIGELFPEIFICVEFNVNLIASIARVFVGILIQVRICRSL